MNKHQLGKALDQAYRETWRLRIAIIRAVGRDPYELAPPSDEILIAELVRLNTASTVTAAPVGLGDADDESGAALQS